MILVQVQSEICEVSRQFKSNTTADRFCRHILKIHISERQRRAGPKPLRKNYWKRQSRLYKQHLRDWEAKVGNSVPVKVLISHV